MRELLRGYSSVHSSYYDPKRFILLKNIQPGLEHKLYLEYLFGYIWFDQWN